MVDHEFTVNSFYEHLNNGKLMGTICEKCGAHMIPPRPICLQCGNSTLKGFESSGEGTLETFTVIHVLPPSLMNKAPCIVGIVRIKEGPTITGRIIKIDPEKIKLGMTVKLTPLKEGNRAVIAFKPI